MDALQETVTVETYKGFEIEFTPLVEYVPLEDAFDGSVMDIDELRDKIETHKADYFCAKVSVSKNGIELASDYLGCCYYDEVEDFYTKYKDDYYSDMRETVVDEAIQVIKGLNS